MKLKNIELKFVRGFEDPYRLKKVLEAVGRCEIELSSNIEGVVEFFEQGDSIGLRPRAAKNFRVSCDNINQLPENYEVEIYMAGGGNIEPAIYIREGSLEDSNVCIEKYTLFLIPN